MKNIYIIPILFISLLLSSCSNDFLNENKELDTVISQLDLYLDKSFSETNMLTFQVGQKINASYEVKSFPRSLGFQSFTGDIKDGVVNVACKIDESMLPSQLGVSSLGTLRLYVNGLGSIIINIYWTNEGTPVAEVADNTLDFGAFEESLSVNIYNKSANGILHWEIIEYPKWIEPLVHEGILFQNDVFHISVKCHRADLERGNYESNLIIKTNDKNNPIISIKIKTESRGTSNPDNIFAIKGTVKDAAYSKINEELYVLTQNPNAMLVYSGKSGDAIEIALPKAPNCMTISEDGKTAYVGHSELMSIVDLKNRTVKKSVDLSFNVFDIAYGENNSCYMTVKLSSTFFYGYYQYNMETNSLNPESSYSSNIYSNTHLLKIKNKPLMIATRTSVSPNGIILLDISHQSGTEKYWHQSLGNRFWSTEDGNYLVGNYGYVFKTPSLSTSIDNNIMEIGILNDRNYSNYIWIEHNAKTNLFYTITNDNYGKNEIRSYDATDYYIKDKVDFYNTYYTTINGIADHYQANPFYLFSNKMGDQLYILRNVDKSEYIAWSLEILKL